MLRYRIVSGVAMLVALGLAAFYLPVAGLFLICVAVGALGQFEFYRLAQGCGLKVYPGLGIFGGVLVLGAFLAGSLQTARGVGSQEIPFELLALVFVALACFVRQFSQEQDPHPLETMGVTLMGVLYVPMLLGCFLRLAVSPGEGDLWGPLTTEGRLQIFFLVAVVKAGDTGAFFTGRALGRHKLCPRISPAKTWEGLLGGCLGAVVVGVLFWKITEGMFVHHVPGIWDVAILALGLTLSGVVGDMFESLIKRAACKKDSSAAIPGMGGLLDVLDSLLFAAPVLYTYTVLFL